MARAPKTPKPVVQEAAAVDAPAETEATTEEAVAESAPEVAPEPAPVAESTPDIAEATPETIALAIAIQRGDSEEEALRIVAEQEMGPGERAKVRHHRGANESLCQAIESDEAFIAALNK